MTKIYLKDPDYELDSIKYDSKLPVSSIKWILLGFTIIVIILIFW